jgi:hypothetical protein
LRIAPQEQPLGAGPEAEDHVVVTAFPHEVAVAVARVGPRALAC